MTNEELERTIEAVSKLGDWNGGKEIYAFRYVPQKGWTIGQKGIQEELFGHARQSHFPTQEGTARAVFKHAKDVVESEIARLEQAIKKQRDHLRLIDELEASL